MSNIVVKFIKEILLNRFNKNVIKKDIKEVKKQIRTSNLNTNSVTRKFIDPKINQKSLTDAFEKSNGYFKYPKGKTYWGSLEYLYKYANNGKMNPSITVSVPMRSKDPVIDLVAKEMLDSKKDMKNYLQSKFYRKLLKKKNVAETYIQDVEDNLDTNYNYIIDNPNKNFNGQAWFSRVILNKAGNPKTSTYLHELTHQSSQFGTPKLNYVNSFSYPYYKQGLTKNINSLLINKYKGKISDYLKHQNYTDDEISYLLEDEEFQANFRPIQMIMEENKWQPKQVYRLLEDRKLIDKLGADRPDLIKAVGPDGLADILKNMLKKGGKIYSNNIIRK